MSQIGPDPHPGDPAAIPPLPGAPGGPPSCGGPDGPAEPDGRKPGRAARPGPRPSEEHYRAVYDQAAVGIAEVDLSGRFTRANDRYCEIVGYPREELLGLRFHDITHPDDLPRNLGFFDHVAEHQSAYTIEKRYVRKDGRVVWARAAVALVRDANGRPGNVVAVAEDITERVRLEGELRLRMQEIAEADHHKGQLLDSLRASEERFRALMEQAPFSIQVLSPDGRTLGVNRAWEELWGVTLDQIPDYNLLEDHQLEAKGILPVVRRAFAGEAVSIPAIQYDPNETIPDRSRHRDPRRWVSAVAYPLKDAAGQVREVVLVHDDITERVEAEEALRESDRRKGDFLATLAHELRNPLAPVRNAARLLATNPAVMAEAGAEVEMIGRQVSHLARLVDDLMDVARIERGKLELRREPLDLRAVVRRAADSVRPALAERGHELTLSLPETPVWLEADPTRLEQVLDNLLTNAIKYTEPGGRIAVGAAREGGEAVVRVADTGVGIPPGMLGEVFEMFAQVEDRLARTQGGLGIGLGLARRLVGMHGGTIAASSAGRGAGSEFVVRLPALPGAPPEAARPASGPRGGRRPELPRVRVLVVDDNADAADSLARLLAVLHGQDVRVAHDGPSALAAAGEFRPDVVFLDIGMPGMDGYEVARLLRGRPGFESTALVALTGWGQESDRQKTRSAGFDHHVVKPVDPDVLGDVLAAALAARPPAG